MEMEFSFILLLLVIAPAFITDMTRKKIPNLLTVTGAAIGLIYHFIAESWQGLLFAAVGSLCGFSALFLLYLLGAVGAGDVKLFAAVGALVGAQQTADIFIYSIIFAGFIGILILLIRRLLLQRLSWLKRQLALLFVYRSICMFDPMKSQELTTFPFMIAVLPAVIISGLGL